MRTPRRPNSDFPNGATQNGVHTVQVSDDGPPFVVCEECEWSRQGAFGSMETARKAAHRHVASTGHLVSVTRMTTHVYGPVS